jgi:hypothetical protein
MAWLTPASCCPGAGVVDDVGVAAFGESEPSGQFAGPRGQLAAAGLLAYLVGGLPGGLSGLAFAKVEVQAAEQQPQPASGHQQVAVLPQGEPSAQELGTIADAVGTMTRAALRETGGHPHDTASGTDLARDREPSP